MRLIENIPMAERDLVKLNKLEEYILDLSPERLFFTNEKIIFSYETRRDTHWHIAPKEKGLTMLFLRLYVSSFKEDESGCVISFVDIEFLSGEQIVVYHLEKFITYGWAIDISRERLSLMQSRFECFFCPLKSSK
jgi:hypothetical protein